MAHLLVSVRSPAEAVAALEGGAALIDVKEPSRGPLGRADEDTITAIVQTVAGRRPVSVALGELLDHSEPRPPHPQPLSRRERGAGSPLPPGEGLGVRGPRLAMIQQFTERDTDRPTTRYSLHDGRDRILIRAPQWSATGLLDINERRPAFQSSHRLGGRTYANQEMGHTRLSK